MARFGLQVWDASGRLILDTGDRVARLIGIAGLTGGVNGSVSDARMNSGGWVCYQIDQYIGHFTNGPIKPRFSLSAGVVSWTYPPKNDGADIYTAGLILYGAW